MCVGMVGFYVKSVLAYLRDVLIFFKQHYWNIEREKVIKRTKQAQMLCVIATILPTPVRMSSTNDDFISRQPLSVLRPVFQND